MPEGGGAGESGGGGPGGIAAGYGLGDPQGPGGPQGAAPAGYGEGYGDPGYGYGDVTSGPGDYGAFGGYGSGGYDATGTATGHGGGPGAPQFFGGRQDFYHPSNIDPLTGHPVGYRAPPPPPEPFKHPSFDTPTEVVRPEVARSPLLDLAKPILSNMNQQDWQSLLRGIYMGSGNAQ